MITITKKYHEPQYGMIEETQIFTSLGEIFDVFTDVCVNQGAVPDTIYLEDQNDDEYEIPLYDFLTEQELKDIEKIVASDLLPYEMSRVIWDYITKDMNNKDLDKEIEI